MFDNYNLRKNYAILREKLGFISKSLEKSLEEIDNINKKFDNAYVVNNNNYRALSKLENDILELDNHINRVLLVEVDNQLKLMNK